MRLPSLDTTAVFFWRSGCGCQTCNTLWFWAAVHMRPYSVTRLPNAKLIMASASDDLREGVADG